MARTKKHPGYIERHGSGYRVSLCVRGARRRFSVAAESKAAAAEWAAAKYAELERQAAREQVGLPGAVTCSQLFAAFRREALPTKSAGTQNAYKDSLKVIEPYFTTQLGDPTLHQVRRTHVKQYMEWRRAHPQHGTVLAPRTVNKDKVVLGTVFSFAMEHEWCDHNPAVQVRALKQVKKEHPRLSPADFAKLLGACGDVMLQLYLMILWETGMRPGEPFTIQWGDLDFTKNVIRLHGADTKTKTARAVALSATLVSALKAHAAAYRFAQYRGEPSPYVLHHLTSAARRIAGGRIGNLGDGFRAAATLAKMPPGLTLHSLRHNYVSRMVEAGHPLTLIARQVGHSNIKMTDYYTTLNETAIQALVAERPTPRAAAQG
jgi:integrase